jgi:hypothetical protein
MDIGTSTGLAFASGINAYLPVLVLGLAARIWPTQFHVDAHFAFITQPWFLIIMAILALADIFADKIPVVDHTWDAIHTVVRPAAGALVAAAAGNQTMDSTWLPLTLVLGAGVAGITHTSKAAVRVTSTATTGGCLNAVLSIAEDIVMAFSVLLAFVAPHVILVAVLLFIVAFCILVPRIVRRLRRKRPSYGSHSAPTVPLHRNSSSRF